MARDKIRVQGVLMTRDAAQRVKDTETDVQADIEALRTGTPRETLLACCLEGFDETESQTVSSWQDYVDAVFEAAKGPELHRLETLRKKAEALKVACDDFLKVIQ